MHSGPVAITSQVRVYFAEFRDILKNALKMGITEPQYVMLGQTIVLYNEKDSRQRFIQGPEIADIVTAFAVGCGKRLAAVAERGDHPKIHIFDLKSFRKNLTLVNSSASQSKEYTCLAFSADDKFIMSVTGAPEWMVTFWSLEKGEVIAECQCTGGQTINQCSFSPFDSNVVCLVGRDCVKYYRLIDCDVRLLSETIVKDQNFVSHCWLRHPDDHVVAGADNGSMVLFRSGEKAFHLNSYSPLDTPITSLVAVPGGFVAGVNPCKFLFFTVDCGQNDRRSVLTNENIKLAQTVVSELSKREASSLAINPSENKLCAITTDGQLLTIPLHISGSASIFSSNSDSIRHSLTPFHGPKAVVGLDVCARKSLFVTIGKDLTFRVWNIQTHQSDLIKEFGEEMFSVALHPAGLHVAIGFLDKLRLYHILLDDLRLCVELPVKCCRVCVFSQGGNLLATANGNIISVFDSHTGERVVDLRGHNGKVRSLHWLQSGTRLLSCGQDGMVYLWNLDGPTRTAEFVKKRSMFTSVVIAQEREGRSSSTGAGVGAGAGVGVGGDPPREECVFVVGSDRTLSELKMPDLTAKKHHDVGALMTHLVISTNRNILLASVGDSGKPGHIRAYSYPVTGESNDFSCLGACLTALQLTPDGQFLLAGDDAGCIALYEVTERQEKVQLNASSDLPKLMTCPGWRDEVLVTRTELEDRSNTVAELKTKVHELKLNNEYQLKLKEMTYSEKVKETNGKSLQDVEHAKQKLDVMRQEMQDSEDECLKKLRLIDEKHQQECQEGEAGFQIKIMALVRGYHDLLRVKDAQTAKHQNQRKQLLANQESAVEEKTKTFERKLDDVRRARVKQEKKRDVTNRQLAETESQLKEDVNTEVDNMRKMYMDRLAACRENILKHKGEMGIMRKKGVVIHKEMEDQREETRSLQERESELRSQIKVLDKEGAAHKREIKTRDNALEEKEKKIFELKKNNQELDKFKFVLDYKIKELKEQVEPRQEQITEMRVQVKTLDTELAKYHASNASLDKVIGTLRERIEKFHSDVKASRQHCNQQESAIECFKSDIQRIVPVILDPTELRNEVEKLVAAHDAQGGLKPWLDADVENEYNRNRDYLHQSVAQLKTSITNRYSDHKASVTDLMKSNLVMIEDINKQRDCNKILKLKVQSDIGELRRIYQVAGHRTEHPEGQGAGEGEGEGEGEGKGMSESMSDIHTEHRQAHAEDLTMQLYRNRQRLMALRSAVQELENKASSMSFSVPVLPPIEGSVLLDDVKATSVFMTARVPLQTAVRSTLDTESKAGEGEGEAKTAGAGAEAEEKAREEREAGEEGEKKGEKGEEMAGAEAEAEAEAKGMKELGEEAIEVGAKAEEEEDRGDLFASLDEEVLSKINDSHTAYIGEVINVHSIMPLTSDL